MNLAPLLDELAAEIAGRVAEMFADRLPAAAPAGEPWRLLNVEETAARLGRSTRWVRDRKDEIGWIRLDGGALAFDVDDLRRFARERQIGCKPLASAEDSLQTGDFSRASLRGEQKALLVVDRAEA